MYTHKWHFQAIQYGHLIRIEHWIKNLVILLPAFFAGKIQDILSLSCGVELIKLFVLLSCASSSIYILNDFLDIKADQRHPLKRNRPLASGQINKGTAIVIASICMIGLLITALSFKALDVLVYVFSYLVLNILYSIWLKHIAIVDVACIAIGFILRILAGGEVLDIPVSHWMVVITFLLSISIAFAKRRDDFMLQEGNDTEVFRKVQHQYSVAFLDHAKGISFSVTLVAYLMYVLSDQVIQEKGSDQLYITALFVFLGIMRYLLLTMVEKKSGAPIQILKKDRFLQVILCLWLLSFSIILYG